MSFISLFSFEKSEDGRALTDGRRVRSVPAGAERRHARGRAPPDQGMKSADGSIEAPLLGAGATLTEAHVQEPGVVIHSSATAASPPRYESLPRIIQPAQEPQEPTSSSGWVAHAVSKAERLRCLDALRGVAITIMVFVNAGGAPQLNTGHTAWDSNDAPLLHLADYACPFFVYCIGAAMAVAFVPQKGSTRPARSRTTATKHAVRRFLLMGCIGLFIKNGTIRAFGQVVDLSVLRLPSVLGRLGGAYLIVAMVLIWVPAGGPKVLGGWASATLPEVAQHGWRHLAILGITLLYLVLTFLVPAPGCPAGYLGPGGTDCGPHSPWARHVRCGHCNHTTTEGCPLLHCTAGFMGHFDKMLLGTRHLANQGRHGSMCAEKYSCIEFDDNGPFGVLPSTFHVFLGFTACRALIESATPLLKVKRLLGYSVLYAAAGLLLDLFGLIPISKNMWSLSFCLWTSGVASALLCLLYLLIDHPTVRVTKGGIIRMLGQNSLGLYVISELVDDTLESFCIGGRDYKHCTDDNTFRGAVSKVLRDIARHVSHGGEHELDQNETVLYALANVLLIMLFAWWFDYRGIIIKL